MLVTAIIPISLIGFGLMLYNYLRFDNPFEFGLHYQLVRNQQHKMPHLFNLKYLWFNFRVYFLVPVRWNILIPFFMEGGEVPPVPAGHLGVESTLGVLPSIPFVWMALALPLAWQKRPADERLVLRFFMAAMVVFFGISALTICLYAGACVRYQVEFVPMLVLLAVGGVLSLERALNTKPQWRTVARCGWIAILFFSVAVNLFLSYEI
jgi:hypothetical protein